MHLGKPGTAIGNRSVCGSYLLSRANVARDSSLSVVSGDNQHAFESTFVRVFATPGKTFHKVMKSKLLVLLLGFVAATQIFAPNSRAQGTPALSFTGGGSFGPFAGTYGWSFTLTSTIMVADLGYFDFGDNGLAASHDVGIWTSTGALLVSATVPSGSAGTLINDFRYVLVAPTILTPGNYVIGGFDSGSTGDAITVGASTITTASGITYGASRSIGGSSLTFPTGDAFGHPDSYFGPNFIFVPEPTTLGLLLFGGLTAFGLRRKR